MNTTYRKALLAATILALTLTAAACGGGGDFSSPEATLRTHARAFEKRDIELMRRSLVTAERADFELETKGVHDIASVATGKIEDTGDGYKVGVLKIKGKGGDEGEFPVVLVQEEGEWRVSYERLAKIMFGDMFNND